MRKGKAQIEQDVYDALAEFFACNLADGDFYQSDCRPLDSRTEDAVVVPGDPTGGQYQEGRVRLLVFIPDIDIGTGRTLPDKERIQQVEAWGAELLDILADRLTDYAFRPLSFSGGQLDDTAEHFVDFNFQYKRQTF